MSKIAQEMQRLADGIFQRQTPPSIRREKNRKKKAEKKVKVDVRGQCEERDGDCRIANPRPGDEGNAVVLRLGDCDGMPEWAHLDDKRRSKTRGQAPEVRHTTVDSLIACRRHHAMYDGRERPRFTIEKLTTRGADGPLRYQERKTK